MMKKRIKLNRVIITISGMAILLCLANIAMGLLTIFKFDPASSEYEDGQAMILAGGSLLLAVPLITWLALQLLKYLPTQQKPEICCPKCEYNMRGLTEAKCPECGEQFTLDQLKVN